MLDRNHLEPHPASSAWLRRLTETHEVKDMWRGFSRKKNQYTWNPCRDYSLLLARLDRFYCFKYHFSIFKSCHIVPVGLSAHCLDHCSFRVLNVKTFSAYWHFNTLLLSDHCFGEAFKFLRCYIQSTKKVNIFLIAAVVGPWEDADSTALSTVYTQCHQEHYQMPSGRGH